MRSAIGLSRSASYGARPPRGTVATMRQPVRRASSTASCHVAVDRIGSRSALPIEPRSAFHPNGSAHAGRHDALAPPPRRRAQSRPRCPDPGRRRRRRAGRERVHADTVRGRSARATTGLDDRTGLIAAMTGAVATATSHPDASACDASGPRPHLPWLPPMRSRAGAARRPRARRGRDARRRAGRCRPRRRAAAR